MLDLWAPWMDQVIEKSSMSGDNEDTCTTRQTKGPKDGSLEDWICSNILMLDPQKGLPYHLSAPSRAPSMI